MRLAIGVGLTAVLAACGQPGAAPAGVASAQAQPTAQAQAPARAEPARDAEAWVRRLYARYAMPPEEVDGETAEFQLETVYTPEVVALIHRDSELHPEGVGYVDADFICQCQDYANLRLGSVTTTYVGPDRAETDVRFTIDGGPYRARLRLQRTADGWRVADVIGGDATSGFVGALRTHNETAARTAGAVLR